MVDEIVPEILNEKTFDRLVDYVKLKGKCVDSDNEYYSNSGDYSSFHQDINIEIESLKLDNIEIRLTYKKIDEKCSDTMMSYWSEKQERTLEFLKEGQPMFDVYQFLGEKKGSGGRGFRSSEKSLPAESWVLGDIKYAEKIPDLVAKIDEVFKAYDGAFKAHINKVFHRK